MKCGSVDLSEIVKELKTGENIEVEKVFNIYLYKIQVKEALFILIQQNLVEVESHSLKSKRQKYKVYNIYQYKQLNPINALTRLRFGRILRLCEHLFGREGELILDIVLENGRAMCCQIVEKLLSGEYIGLNREKVINTLNNMINRKFLISALEKPSSSSSSSILASNKIELELPKSKNQSKTSSSAIKRKPKPLLQINKKIKTEISSTSTSSSIKSDFSSNNNNNLEILNDEKFYKVNYDEFTVEFKKMTIIRYIKDTIDERGVGIVEGILNVISNDENPKDKYSLSLTLDDV